MCLRSVPRCVQQLFPKEPIRTVEEFRGKPLRVHNPQTVPLMVALGAKHATLPLAEVMPALERRAWIPEDLQQATRAEMAGFRKEALTGHYGFVRAAMEQMKAEELGFRVAPPSGLDRTFDPKYRPGLSDLCDRAAEIGLDGQTYVQLIRELRGKDLVPWKLAAARVRRRRAKPWHRR